MNCKNFDQFISSYVDDQLTKEEKQAFDKHINECDICNTKYNNFVLMLEAVQEIDEIPLPKNFTEELNKKLRESTPQKKRSLPKRWKLITAVAASLLVVVISAAMMIETSPLNMRSTSDGAAGEEYAGQIMVEEDTAMAMDSPAEAPRVTRQNEEKALIQEEAEVENFGTTAEETDTTVMTTERKIIQQGHIAVEVENFDDKHDDVVKLVEDANGYIQQKEIYYYYQDREKPENSLRNAYMTLRVPSEDFISIFNRIKELGLVVEENTSGEDITDSYMDIDNQVANLKVQEERLREILQKAEDVEDLLQIENELNRIRTQINSLASTLKSYDGLVSMSTIHLHLRQVKDSDIGIQSINEGLWSRAKSNFIYSINSIINLFEKGFIGLFGILPLLLLLTVVGGPIGVLVYRKWYKNQ